MVISIIIPTYNEEDYLPILLESIKSQKYDDYEIIIADAQSTDKTREIAENYGCIIVDGGMPGVGRNRGAEVAKGEYLLFLDSDLKLLDNFLEDMLNEFEEKELDIAIGQMEALTDDKTVKTLHNMANTFMKASEKIKPHGAGCYGIITKKELHDKIGGFDEKLTFGEDTDYIERIGKGRNFKVLRTVKVGVSTRRLDEEGLETVIKQYGKSTIRDFLGKKTEASDLDYNFGHSKENPKKTIFYCICGEGMGHAIRSGTIIEELKNSYDIHIFTSNRAYNYLNERFNQVNEIGCFTTVYEDNKVNNLKTFAKALKENPANLKEGYEEIYKKAKKLKPSVIITDFENYGSLAATILKIPLISIDNMHIMSETEIEYPEEYHKEMLKAKAVIKTYVPKAKIRLITSFFYPKIREDKNAILFPPVLRKNIIELDSKIEDYILVYQTSEASMSLIEKLKDLDERFIVYGFDKEQVSKNLNFKKFNDDEFYEDLANCKAVVCNGGFTLITEAIHLKKPIFSIPAQGNFEQILNGYYVQKLGYGKFNKDMDIKELKLFLSDLDKYQNTLNKVKKTDNTGILKELEHCIEKYSK